MADVTLKYKGATIGELSETGNKTIETAGKYCEADILLEYVKKKEGGAINVSPLTNETTFVGSVNSLKNAVINELGDVPFFARHISGPLSTYTLIQLLYIPARFLTFDNNGWMIMSGRIENINVFGAAWFTFHRTQREADIGNNYSYNISSNSIYAAVDLSDLFTEIFN